MAERRPSAGSSALNQVDKDYKYGGDTALGALIPKRREILREEIQNQLIGYDDRGREIRQTIPAQYGESEVDFSYSPVVRGAKAAGSFLNDIFFGDANEQSEAAGRAVSAVRGVVGGLGDYASDQYQAGMAGGTTYDPETRQITEFDPTIVMGGGGAGMKAVRNTPSNQVILGTMGSKTANYTPDQRKSMDELERQGMDTENLFLHGTSDDIKQPTSRKTSYRDTGWLGEGFYGATPKGSRISDFYANTAAPRFRNEAGDYSEPNVFPYITRRGNYKQYSLMDKAGMGIVAQMNPNYSKDLTRKNIDEGFIGAEVIDADGSIVERVSYFPDTDTRSALNYDTTALYSGGGRQGTAIAGGSALRNEFERQFGGAIPEVTRDTPLLQRVGDPASVNEMTVEMSSPQISSVPIVKAEDLIDRPYITGMSDTSRSGLERVTSVNDVPVDVLMRGGKYFGAQPENIERGVAFASAPNAVMGQLNRAAAAQSLGGRPVAFIPYGMMPTSPDFATMTTDLMVPYASQVMSKSDKKALDKRIRSGANSMTNEFTPIPNWVGIDKADEEYLANLGGLRKAVEKSLDEFRDAGSLNLSQARAIVTDPTQFNPAFGDIDMIYELNPEAVKNRTFLESNHPSYPAALAGRPLGALRDTEKANIFEFDVLAGTADTEFYNFRDAELAKGRPFEIGGKLKSPTMKAFAPGGHGRITQDMVDDLIRRGLVIP